MIALGCPRPRAAASVFGRLRIVTLVAFALGISLSIVAAWTFTAAVARQSYDRLLQSAAAQIAETLAAGEAGVTASPPDAAFETLALAEGDRFFYSVRDPAGRLVTGYRALPPVPPHADPGTAVFSNRRFRDAAVRVVTVRRFVGGGARAGWASVTVAQTLAARHAVAFDLLAKVVAVIVFLGGVGLIAFLAAARQALRPLRRVELELASRETTDLSPMTNDHPREVEALVATINRMMTRVSERLGRLRSFTAVAAHQIRTPLAALSAQIDVLLTATDPAQRPRLLRLAARVEELSRLTQQLLGHAMVAYREEGVPRTALDIADIAREATSAGLPATLGRDIEVTFDAPTTPIEVAGDRTMLHEAIRNLVDNAVAHGAPGHLAVTVGEEGGAVAIRVADDGPGLPPEKWPLAQQPFALARDGGVGLGLSIAHAVAAAHSGTLGFGHLASGWFCVTMRLPTGGAAG